MAGYSTSSWRERWDIRICHRQDRECDREHEDITGLQIEKLSCQISKLESSVSGAEPYDTAYRSV